MGITETRGIASNSFSYEGLVRVSTVKNGRKTSYWLKNSGTKALGKLIAMSLLKGISINDSEKPNSLGFIANGNKGIGTISLLRNNAPLTVEYCDDDYALPKFIEETFPEDKRLSVLYLYAIIDSTSVLPNFSGLKNLQLCILDQHRTPLAYIENDENKTFNLIYDALKTQDVIVEWYMIFTNNEVNEDGK